MLPLLGRGNFFQEESKREGILLGERCMMQKITDKENNQNANIKKKREKKKK